MQLRFSALACVLAVLPTAAEAQPSDSFEGLMNLIELQEDVQVVYADRIVRGRAVAVSPSSLTVLAAGARLELDADLVHRVRQRWDDPSSDGGLKGAAVGAAAYAVLHMLESQYEGEGFDRPLVGAGIFGMGGFLIGSAFDAWWKGTRVIYRAPAGRPRATVSPLLSDERTGAALSIAW